MLKPRGPYNVPMKLLSPVYTTSRGVQMKTYPDPETVSDDFIIMGSFKTFGGTDKVVNGVLSIENTAAIETWWRPDIKSDCAVGLLETGEIYEIMADPEDVERRHQFMILKVKRIKGGV